MTVCVPTEGVSKRLEGREGVKVEFLDIPTWNPTITPLGGQEDNFLTILTVCNICSVEKTVFPLDVTGAELTEELKVGTWNVPTSDNLLPESRDNNPAPCQPTPNAIG